MWHDDFEQRLRRDVCLAEMTTVRIGGRARFVVTPADVAETSRLLAALRSEGQEHRVLGGGSNLLPPDEEVDAVVIHPVLLDRFEIDGARIHAGAGVSLSALVAKANQAGLAGAEGLAGIPGQLGGALAMNAGGRHGEIAEIVERVTVVLDDGRTVELEAADLAFSYRSSKVPEGAVIVEAVLRLRPGADPRELKRTSGSILKEKNRAQPTTGWNFGCMFKNPPGGSAGKLVEAAGLKGLTKGRVRISPLHGNFVENLGGGTAADVRWLLAEATRAVQQAFGVELEREVRVWTSHRELGAARG